MFRNKTILAVVPARGGSKGVLKKNIREILGIPIVGIAGMLISQIECIDYRVVSTDDPEIASIATQFGLEVPFLRPEELSGDRIGDVHVLQHALETVEKLKNVTIDIVLMIQPTSPMRKISHVMDCLSKQYDGDYDSVITVSETDLKFHPYKQFEISNENLSWFDKQNGDKIVGRQDLTKTYHKNGACYAINRNFLLNCEKDATPIGEKSSYVITEDMISIDNEEDFQRVEKIINSVSKSINEFIRTSA